MKKITLFIVLIVSFACAEENINLNTHEILYYNVADSLVKYKSEIEKVDGGDDETIQDFMMLDFDEFKKKHKMSDLEMDEVSNSLKTTFEIFMTYKSIEENISKAKELDDSMKELSKDMEKNNTDYKFDPNKTNVDSNSFLIDVLKSAKDVDVKTK